MCCGRDRYIFKIKSFSFKELHDHVENKGFIPILTSAENTTVIKVAKVVLEKYLDPKITDKYLNTCTRPEIIKMLLKVAVDLKFICETGIQLKDPNESVSMRILISKRDTSKAEMGTPWTADDELFLLVGLLVYGWSHMQSLQLLLPTKSYNQLRGKREKFRSWKTKRGRKPVSHQQKLSGCVLLLMQAAVSQ